MIKKYYILAILLLLVSCGLFLRLYHLGAQSYWMDEGYTVNAVDALLRNGTNRFASILDSGATYFCPLYCTPTAAIVQLLGKSPAAYRMLSVWFGLIAIGLIYIVTNALFQDTTAGILAAGFTTFSYWQIAWSRQARWYTMLEVFFWLALLFFHRFCATTTVKKKLAYLIASLICTFLSIIVHPLAYGLPVIMLLWWLYTNRPTTKKIIVIASAVTACTLLLYVFGRIQLHYTLPYYLNFYLRNYWPLLLLSLYGYFGFDREQKKKVILLMLPFAVYLFALSFFTNIVHYRYLFHTTIAIYIVGAVATMNIVQSLRNVYIKRLVFCAIIVIFFLSGNGVLWPKNFYDLESDDPTALQRPYYAYTPQPDFTAAYAKIKASKNDTEIIISSHPHFNKIFLNQAGYWLRYDYLGMEDTASVITDNREYYVGASVINNLDELKNLTSAYHGYIVFDYMATDGRIDPMIISYIENNFTQFFYDEHNSYSKIWVYRF